jgi:hypothetical protein
MPTRRIGADRFDRAGNLEARQIRSAGRRRVLAEALQDVRSIDSGRFYAYQHLTVTRRRDRSFDQT